MQASNIITRGILNECIFTFSRGSGPGGQHVNKVNTKVELRFSVKNSQALTDDEKWMIINKMGRKINQDGELILTSQAGRSQLQNKNRVTERFINLITRALTKEKIRISTIPTPGSRQKRIENKKKQGEKKKRRISPEPGE